MTSRMGHNIPQIGNEIYKKGAEHLILYVFDAPYTQFSNQKAIYGFSDFSFSYEEWILW